MSRKSKPPTIENLQLNKETLRDFTDGEGERIVGGAAAAENSTPDCRPTRARECNILNRFNPGHG